jgi:hypothetical protein
MVRFIDDYRDVYGVEPICRVIPIASSTYYAFKAREADASLRSARSKRDEALKPEIQRVWDENLQVYGAEKVWRQLNREAITVARCTVERLMRDMGLEGTVRGRRCRTTVPADEGDSHAARRTSSASVRILGPMNGDRASSVTSSTRRSRRFSSNSESSRKRSKVFAPGENSTRMSPSLSGRASPRSTDPKSASRFTPSARISASAASRRRIA